MGRRKHRRRKAALPCPRAHARDHLPEPLDSGHYVVLNSGLTFGAKEFQSTNALLYPRLGDYAIIRKSDGAVVLAGIFDENWQLPASKR